MEERANAIAHIKMTQKPKRNFKTHKHFLSLRKDNQKRRSFNQANKQQNPKSTKRLEFHPKEKKKIKFAA